MNKRTHRNNVIKSRPDCSLFCRKPGQQSTEAARGPLKNYGPDKWPVSQVPGLPSFLRFAGKQTCVRRTGKKALIYGYMNTHNPETLCRAAAGRIDEQGHECALLVWYTPAFAENPQLASSTSLPLTGNLATSIDGG